MVIEKKKACRNEDDKLNLIAFHEKGLSQGNGCNGGQGVKVIE